MSSTTAFFLLICLGLASAAVYIEYQKPQPGRVPFCVDKVEGKKSVGEEWHDPKECLHKRCLTDSQGTPLISYASCGAIATPDNDKCRLVKPEGNKSYPDCCPTVVCDDKPKE